MQPYNDWAHAPPHKFFEPGTFIVTGATYQKEKLFSSPEKLDYLSGTLLSLLIEFQWRIEAWAVFANHYHFVAVSRTPENLPDLIHRLHGTTSHTLNKWDNTPHRQVLFQYWDTRITSPKSRLARLQYVHRNAVKHKLVTDARDYKWCSATWLHDRAESGFRRTLERFKVDTVNVIDDFD